MKIVNTVTYTSQGREFKAQIIRGRKLTHRGAEIIVRRIDQDAIVVRVESAAQSACRARREILHFPWPAL